MKKGLLVVDMINGIAANGSCSKYVQQAPVLDNINKLITTFRKQKLPIYFIRLAFEENYPDYPAHSKIFNAIRNNHKFLIGSDDVNFIDGLDYQENKDRVFNKTATNPFHHSGLLDAILEDNVEHLIFTGLATDNAINIGSRFAHDEGFKTTVVDDACGASTIEMHEAALMLLNKIVNEMTDTENFIKEYSEK